MRMMIILMVILMESVVVAARMTTTVPSFVTSAFHHHHNHYLFGGGGGIRQNTHPASRHAVRQQQQQQQRFIPFHIRGIMNSDDATNPIRNKNDDSSLLWMMETTNETTTTLDIMDRATTPMSLTLNDTSKSKYTSHISDGNIQQYIGTMDDRIQQFTFIMAFVLLGLGTQCCIHLWYTWGIDFMGPDYMYQIQTHIFPILFGSIFGMVGIGHFVFVENFARIVPPYNCWGGLWKVPAPFYTTMNITYEAYHSYWTGIVEFMGGIWLLYSGIMSSSSTTSILPATLLFALTIGVTPANLYMFTHNASPGGVIPPLQYPFGHIARFIIQCGLLSNFYIMMHPVQLEYY